MGLDQYAYARPVGVESDDGKNNEELTYWRKHNRLQGWMEELWEDRGRPNVREHNPGWETSTALSLNSQSPTLSNLKPM